LAVVLHYVGFGIVIAYICLANIFYQRTKLYLFEKDKRISGQIRPNRINIVFSLIPFLGFALIILGAYIQSDSWPPLFILAVGGCMMLGT